MSARTQEMKDRDYADLRERNNKKKGRPTKPVLAGGVCTSVNLTAAEAEKLASLKYYKKMKYSEVIRRGLTLAFAEIDAGR